MAEELTPVEKFVLEKMRSETKTPRVKMSHFQKTHYRPTPNSVIAYELYGSSMYNERDILGALKSLEAKGIIESSIRGPKFETLIWYSVIEPKEDEEEQTTL